MGSPLDRKVLAEMAVNAPEAFGRLVVQVKNALA
jgi:ribosomal protein L20